MKKTVLLIVLQCCALLSVPARAGNENGSAGDMPAYYDHHLLTINFMELPSGGESANLARNMSINTIFMSMTAPPGQDMFIPVLDQITGGEVESPPKSGFNPLWDQVLVVFPDPSTAVQFCRDDDIRAAAAAGSIMLVDTGNVFRCSVVGKR